MGGLSPKPGTFVMPCRPPPALRTAKGQPFCSSQVNVSDPMVCIAIASGSCSMTHESHI